MILESCNKVSWIGRAAFYCALLAIGSSIFCFLSLPIDDSGLYGYIAIGLFAVAFVLGFASLAAMLITRNFSGIIKTLLAIVLSFFPLLSVTMIEMSVRGRQKVAIVGSGRKNPGNAGQGIAKLRTK